VHDHTVRPATSTARGARPPPFGSHFSPGAAAGEGAAPHFPPAAAGEGAASHFSLATFAGDAAGDEADEDEDEDDEDDEEE
jgi:hypothetical protein